MDYKGEGQRKEKEDFLATENKKITEGAMFSAAVRIKEVTTAEGKQEYAVHRFLRRRPKAMRQELLKRPWEMPILAMHYAAHLVQKVWLASWLRQAKPQAFAQLNRFIKKRPNGEVDKSKDGSSVNLYQNPVAAVLRQRYLDLLRARCSDDGIGTRVTSVYHTFKSYCAAMIQGRFRSRKMIKLCHHMRMYKKVKLYQVAAYEIQCIWRVRRQRLHKEKVEYERELAHSSFDGDRRHAAVLVQRYWRQIMDHRVYQSLKDTIATFDRSGDPCLLLRSIMPRESLLLDSAMQVHLRFRLGGRRFPPSIYYKIYTHGTIIDLGSFAPRNYAAKRKQPHNPGTVTCQPNDEPGIVYCRAENNGWRPLASRLLPTGAKVVDEVEKASARKVYPEFHHSKLRRRQDTELARRRRTVDWMRKMYGFVGGSSPVPRSQYSVGSPAGLHGAARTDAASDQAEVQSGPGGLVPRPPSGGPPANRGPRHRAILQAPQLPEGPAQASAPSAVPSKRQLMLTPGEGPTPTGGDSDYSPQSRTAIGFEPDFVQGDVLAEDYAQNYEQHQWQMENEMDEDVSDEALLEWSRKIDFDDYMQSWQRIATSNDSEGTLKLNKRPPPARNPNSLPRISVR